MRGAKPCPACGFLLRYVDPPDESFDPRRFVLCQLLAWAALALFLAWLWSPPGEGLAYALLALAAFAAWVRLQPRQREAGEALLRRRLYLCARCGRRYRGAELMQDGA